MWLLQSYEHALEYFADPESVPPYLILSHTWGTEEVTFDDIKDLNLAESKQGFRKILYICQEARTRHVNYVWVDTCCIDKKSSAELSESINAMYRYYQKALLCCVYLDDLTEVPTQDLRTPAWAEAMRQSLSLCRWFTRGWTLQELLAPSIVLFYDRHWRFLGDACDLVDALENITRIDIVYLLKIEEISSASIAKRMSWAAERKTTRIEDRAYSLLGIFNIHMPLLYGERHQAFYRLQEEIIRSSVDQTIFAWPGLIGKYSDLAGADVVRRASEMFAPSPDEFVDCGDVKLTSGWNDIKEYSMSNVGLRITLPIV
ncbi:HET-domain-containing protein, partial [Polychaeton citri CBS 116435]